MNMDIHQSAAVVAQVEKPKLSAKAHCFLWLLIGYMFFAIFIIFPFTFRYFIDSSFYVAALAICVVLLFFLLGRFLLQAFKQGRVGWFSLLVGGPFLIFGLCIPFAIVPARIAHMLMPKEEVSMTLTAEGIIRSTKGCAGGGVYFKETYGIFNNRTCTLPKKAYEMVARGDKLHYRVNRSIVGFSLVRLEKITRDQ